MTNGRWRFRVEAIVDPQSLPRVIGFFAQRGNVPVSMSMHVTRDQMHIDLVANDMEELTAGIIAAKLCEQFAVLSVQYDAAQSKLHLLT